MTAATADWVGLVLDRRYKVTAKLGQGGMGFVYRARDERLGCDVVVKVPRAAMLEDDTFRQRFLDEVRALVRLAHPHVVKVTDFGQHTAVPYAVMQYLPGGSLDDRRPKTADGQFKAVHSRTIAEWLPDVADALDFIHRQKYIHRDVKPANILFDAHKNAYISDFGVAKAVAGGKGDTGLTGAGVVLGTPAYMAPELVTGAAPDGRVDQYALAMTVYELLTGEVPLLDSKNVMRTLMRRTTEDAPPLTTVKPHTPAGLSAAVARALARDPEQRFPDCASFAREATRALADGAATRTTVTPGPTDGTTATAKATPRPKPRPADGPSPVFSEAARAEVNAAAPVTGRRRSGVAIGIAAGVLALGMVGLSIWVLTGPSRSDPPRQSLVDPRSRPTPPEAPPPDVPVPPVPPMPMRIVAIRPSPTAMALTPGGPAETLVVEVDRTGAEAVRVAVQPTDGFRVMPGERDLASGERVARFEVVAEPGATSDRLRVAARRGDDEVRMQVPVTVRSSGFRIALERPGPVMLATKTTVGIAVTREPGFAAPVRVSVAETDLVRAAEVTVAAGQSKAGVPLEPKSPDQPGPGTVTLRASAPGVAEQTLSVVVRPPAVRLLRAFPSAGSAVVCIAVAEQAALTGHADGSVRLWDLDTGEPQWTATKHTGPVTAVAFSPDRREVLSGGEDRKAILWDAAKGTEVKRFDNAEHGTPIWRVAFVPRGTPVQTPDAPADAPDPPVKAKARSKAKSKSRGASGTETLAEQSPVTQSDDRLVYWDAKTGNPHRYGGRKNQAGLIENQKPTSFPAEPRGRDTKIAVERGHTWSGFGGDTLTVATSAVENVRLPGHGKVIAAAISADGRRAVAVSEGGQVRAWDLVLGKLLDGSPWSAPGRGVAAALSADGRTAFLGTADGGVSSWTLPD